MGNGVLTLASLDPPCFNLKAKKLMKLKQAKHIFQEWDQMHATPLVVCKQGSPWKNLTLPVLTRICQKLSCMVRCLKPYKKII